MIPLSKHLPAHVELKTWQQQECITGNVTSKKEEKRITGGAALQQHVYTGLTVSPPRSSAHLALRSVHFDNRLLFQMVPMAMKINP